MQEIYEIIRLAKDYIAVGIVLAAAFLIGYFLTHIKKKNKKSKPLWAVFFAAFICYIVVVIGATMLSRHMHFGMQYVYQLHPFYSYKLAWNYFLFSEWRNIILNILMFVPFGFMLPILFKKLRSFWKVYLAGFAFTLAIELTQLVFRLGIFEVDDLFDNLLGAMIGYGLFSIVFSVYKKVKKQQVKILPVVLQQLPLVLAIAMFSAIFIAYSAQELGNLSSNYIYRETDITVSTESDFSEEEISETVYSARVYSHDEAKQLAQELLDKCSIAMDEDRTIYYENTAYFYGINGPIITIVYNGGAFDYHAFSGDELKADAGRGEIEKSLKALGIDVPEEAKFSNEEEGSYKFSVNKLLVDGCLYDGTIELTYTVNSSIETMYNNMIKYQPYKEFELISEREAYDKLLNGEFVCYYQGEKDIKVLDAELDYQLDTKGYYQPVYRFGAIINGDETEIIIPALKK
ncbi:MAG: VanZ family protein [Eubacterium sp.]|nr:VanZ family protein [Eubacterium sp.]